MHGERYRTNCIYPWLLEGSAEPPGGERSRGRKRHPRPRSTYERHVLDRSQPLRALAAVEVGDGQAQRGSALGGRNRRRASPGHALPCREEIAPHHAPAFSHCTNQHEVDRHASILLGGAAPRHRTACRGPTYASITTFGSQGRKACAPRRPATPSPVPVPRRRRADRQVGDSPAHTGGPAAAERRACASVRTPPTRLQGQPRALAGHFRPSLRSRRVHIVHTRLPQGDL